jgi:hypothetical protein
MKSLYILLISMILLLSACTNTTTNTSLVNNDASLPESFNISKTGLKVITSFINKKQGTMSTLYGNAPALQAAKSGSNITTAGETFALITWKQKADDHWFGANIPSTLQSVEYVKTAQPGNTISYQKFEGKPLVLSTDTLHNQERIKYILNQKASVFP